MVTMTIKAEGMVEGSSHGKRGMNGDGTVMVAAMGSLDVLIVKNSAQDGETHD